MYICIYVCVCFPCCCYGLPIPTDTHACAHKHARIEIVVTVLLVSCFQFLGRNSSPFCRIWTKLMPNGAE